METHVFYRTGEAFAIRISPAAQSASWMGAEPPRHAAAPKPSRWSPRPSGSPVGGVPTAWFESEAQTIEVRQVVGGP